MEEEKTEKNVKCCHLRITYENLSWPLKLTVIHGVFSFFLLAGMIGLVLLSFFLVIIGVGT